MKKIQTIGWIGTGIMGSRMIRNCLKKGFAVSVYNRSLPKAEALAKDGATVCKTIEECVQQKDLIITMVGLPSDVEECYKTIFQNAAEGCIACDMTTSSPSLAKKLYQEGKKHSISLLDAPVSGGDSGAEKGTLAIMVGGDEEAYQQCLPVFEAMGSKICYMGEAGNGQHTKMANQIAIAGCVAGVAEALSYAKTMRLDPTQVWDAIQSGAAGSWQMTNNGPKMIAHDDSPGFLIRHFVKDMRLAKEEAGTKEMSLPILEQAYKVYENLMNQGLEDAGTQAIAKYYKL